MRTFSHKVVGAALAGALALSSVSPAFALSLNADAHALTKIRHEDSSVGSNGSVFVSADSDSRSFSRCKSFSGSHLIRCKAIIEERAEAKGEVKAEVETHGNFMKNVRDDKEQVKTTVAETETRLFTVLKRVLHSAAKHVYRACKAENSDALVRQCVASAKSRIQLQVTAMIDAAFSVN